MLKSGKKFSPLLGFGLLCHIRWLEQMPKNLPARGFASEVKVCVCVCQAAM